MFLTRTELNVITGDQVEIVRQAYKNDAGDVIVLDAGDDEPDGYSAFDPGADVE